MPTCINYQGVYPYLNAYGLTERKEKAIVCTAEDIADCVFKAGNYSVYSVEEQLKQGFLTAKCGERIGISGEYVFDKGKPHALRNFTSLCIRVPHTIRGCALEIYTKAMSDIVYNLLLASPPGMGKTTLLRDLARILSEKTKKNILICDERGEICVGDFGETCDVVRYCDKKTAFTAGIRAMRPEIIITDELSLEDLDALEKAKKAGVTVIASAHFSEIDYIPTVFKDIFDKIVLLDGEKIGVIRAIYNAYD
jgi:stage III sporulation protein AA